MYDQLYIVQGQTYHSKDKLKELGCFWHPDRRMWCTSSNHTANMVKHSLPHLRITEAVSDVSELSPR